MKITMTILLILITAACDSSNESGKKSSSFIIPIDPQEEQAPLVGMKSTAKVTTAININNLNDRAGRKLIDILETVYDEPNNNYDPDCSISLQSGMTMKALRLRSSLRLIDEFGPKVYESIDQIPNRGIQGKWRLIEEFEQKTIRTVILISSNRMKMSKTCLYR